MMELTHPRLFAPLTAARLLPSRLGEGSHASLVKRLLKTKKAPRCEVTGLPLPRSGYGAAIEFRTPEAAKANKLRLADLQVVDEWVFWSRHVELALSEEQGRLIFMPWIGQAELLALARTLHMGRQIAIEKGWGMMKETANLHLEKLALLGDDSLMINALGLPEELESWEPEEWLSAIRDLPIAERKTYMQRFGQHLRFLPIVDSDVGEKNIQEWRSTYQMNNDPQETINAAEAFYKTVMVKLKKHERQLAGQRRPEMA